LDELAIGAERKKGCERAMSDERYEERDEVPADVQARLAMIEQRLEQPMTEAQAEQVKQRIARSIGLGVALRRYPLTNADEPEIALDPFVGAGQ
jgi:tRNA U54 and U55 pseudouridine synthase Pus10